MGDRGSKSNFITKFVKEQRVDGSLALKSYKVYSKTPWKWLWRYINNYILSSEFVYIYN